jgi:hypothetical protein
MRDINTPVALIFFKRPSTTVQVMERIRMARPSKLLLASDGPRLNVPGEAELVEKTRHDVEALIDWDCDVAKYYSASNEGLYAGLPRKLNWIFEQAEKAIVLEDDCVPAHSFFAFCDLLLDYYQDDERIMHISGNNFQRGRTRIDASYYFSRYTHNWGWASWQRAWRHFDANMSELNRAIDEGLLHPILPENLDHYFWTRMLTRNRNLSAINKGPDWDNCWQLTCWLQNGLSIIPAHNLVSNIGYGDGGSHKFSADNRLMNIQTQEMSFPLRHPKHIVRDWKADQFTQNDVFVRGLMQRMIQRLTGKVNP